MDLSRQDASEPTQYATVTTCSGTESFTLGAGGRLWLRKKLFEAGIEDFLDVVVPEGKVWDVSISVQATERDA